MKCENSLVLLLEAERAELEGRGTSAVAAHVRECPQCGAVAARLLADTQVLAAHIAARGAGARSARRSVSRPLVFGGALAAAATIVLMMPARDVRVDASAHVQAAAHVSPAPVAVLARPAPPVRLKALVRIHQTRLAGATAATPDRLVASQDVKPALPTGDSSGVSVIPPPGMRSAVLATRNQKITVVWIY